jgi:choline dehydrogenase
MTDFDYVIVGAGSAGCVLANRLSASGTQRVLLLEAGGSDRSPWIRVPIGYGHSFTNPRVNWMYSAEPDPELDARRAYWPRGKVLGGSSSINAMVYVRGQPHDFDDWAAAGNQGWAWDDVLPYFRRLEDHEWGAAPGRGGGGPVHVSDIANEVHPLCHTFVAACGTLGIPALRDFNERGGEGAGTWQMTIKNGLRVSSATAYLRPARSRRNLEVRTHAHATRVVFEGRRATAVEYLAGGTRHFARARREVIVSAGAVNSPQLLQLSGVGAGGLLQRLGIPLVLDAPAVGQGLQDHVAVSYYYRSRVPTLNDELYPLSGKLRAALRYLCGRHGPLGMSVNQAGAFVRSRPGLAHPNMQLYFNPLSYTAGTGPARRMLRPDPYPAFLLSFNSCRPTSRGSVTIRSPDPLVAPAIVPNSLSTAADLAEVREGAALLRRIAAAAPLAAVIDTELQPGAACQSDAAVLADFRSRAGSVYHASSTCAMGPDAARAVVAPDLRVHGIDGLRVADASVFPTVTSGNTNAPSMMVGERAADLILGSR